MVLDAHAIKTYRSIDVGSTLTVKPTSGTIAKGKVVTFDIVFHPKTRFEIVECVLSIDNEFIPLHGMISGAGDEPRLMLDIPSNIVDFGLCRVGASFHRDVCVLNRGFTGELMFGWNLNIFFKLSSLPGWTL